MQIPKFLRNLLQSNNYWNKDSAEFAKANEYLATLFPGQLQKDATGQYMINTALHLFAHASVKYFLYYHLTH